MSTCILIRAAKSAVGREAMPDGLQALQAMVGGYVIARTTLHLFVGLTVVQTGSVLDESNMTESNTLAPGLGGAAAIVVVMTAWAAQIDSNAVTPVNFGPGKFHKLIG